MAKRERKPMYTSPAGIAVGFIHLNKPDTGGEYSDDKYKVQLAFDAENQQIQELCGKLDELAEQAMADAIEKTKNAKTKKKLKEGEPYVPYEDELDEDGEPTGRLVLKFATKGFYEDRKSGEIIEKKLKIYDAKKKLLKKPPFIGPGSELKIAFMISDPWVNAGQGMAGVSLHIAAVQIINVENNGGASADDFGFGEEDGFSGDDYDGYESDDSDAEEEEEADGDNGDF